MGNTVTAYLVKCGHCGFIGGPEMEGCAKCGYDGGFTADEAQNLGGLWVLLDLDDDARSAVLWALENGEAALRTEKNSWPEPATLNLRHLKRGAESIRQALYHGPKIEEVSNDR